MSESPEADHARMKDAAIIYDQAQTIARLERKIADGPLRPGLENDDPEVIACMGSVPACQQSGCQARVLKEYARHKDGCAATRCQFAYRKINTCNQPEHSSDHEPEWFESHAFIAGDCTCGLSAFLKE